MQNDVGTSNVFGRKVPHSFYWSDLRNTKKSCLTELSIFVFYTASIYLTLPLRSVYLEVTDVGFNLKCVLT